MNCSGPVNRNAFSSVLIHSRHAFPEKTHAYQPAVCYCSPWPPPPPLPGATGASFGPIAPRASTPRASKRWCIRTGAGDMKVVGRGNAVRIEARGVACASKQELLDATQISVRREGNVVYVETTLPQDDEKWSWGDNEYAYIDIGIALPSNIPVEATDSSGDATFEDLKSLSCRTAPETSNLDRSPGCRYRRQLGRHRDRRARQRALRDSSGDIEIDDVRGDVEVTLDSSGRHPNRQGRRRRQACSRTARAASASKT